MKGLPHVSPPGGLSAEDVTVLALIFPARAPMGPCPVHTKETVFTAMVHGTAMSLDATKAFQTPGTWTSKGTCSVGRGLSSSPLWEKAL